MLCRQQRKFLVGNLKVLNIKYKINGGTSVTEEQGDHSILIIAKLSSLKNREKAKLLS